MKVMEMGRWSEFNLTLVAHSTSDARWADMIEISGEEVIPLEGLRVCESLLMIQSGWAVNVSAMISPLAAALSQEDWECQAGWWAFQSPNMRVSSSEWPKMECNVAGDNWWGASQLDAGGR